MSAPLFTTEVNRHYVLKKINWIITLDTQHSSLVQQFPTFADGGRGRVYVEEGEVECDCGCGGRDADQTEEELDEEEEETEFGPDKQEMETLLLI